MRVHNIFSFCWVWFQHEKELQNKNARLQSFFKYYNHNNGQIGWEWIFFCTKCNSENIFQTNLVTVDPSDLFFSVRTGGEFSLGSKFIPHWHIFKDSYCKIKQTKTVVFINFCWWWKYWPQKLKNIKKTIILVNNKIDLSESINLPPKFRKNKGICIELRISSVKTFSGVSPWGEYA